MRWTPWLLVVLAGCGRSSEPPPDLSWLQDKATIAEWTERLPVVSREPVIKGKVVVIDVDRKEVDGTMMWALPKELKPTTKSEVGTVVWIYKSKAAVGVYTGGAAALQTSKDITLIDVAAKESYFWKSFQGGAPPKEVKLTKAEAEDAKRRGITGTDPASQILEFLKGLPRQ